VNAIRDVPSRDPTATAKLNEGGAQTEKTPKRLSGQSTLWQVMQGATVMRFRHLGHRRGRTR
jgi:hypothetical protein